MSKRTTQILNSVLQYDAFDIGFITTDDFTNADILEATFPAIAKRLHGDWINDPAIPIVTGFLGKVRFPFNSHLAWFPLYVSYLHYHENLTIAGLEILCRHHLGKGWQ